MSKRDEVIDRMKARVAKVPLGTLAESLVTRIVSRA